MTRKITIVITNLEFNTETEQWRLHVKTLFENMAFLSLQQGLVKKEPKQNMSSSSEVNRGNFIGIELLSLRAKDVPVVKIETPVNNLAGLVTALFRTKLFPSCHQNVWRQLFLR